MAKVSTVYLIRYYMLTGKWKGRYLVWRHNYIKQLTKILSSDYNTKYATNKSKQITKRTPKCIMTPECEKMLVRGGEREKERKL